MKIRTSTVDFVAELCRHSSISSIFPMGVRIFDISELVRTSFGFYMRKLANHIYEVNMERSLVNCSFKAKHKLY